ncbi:type II toxin-antitoxin system toxin TscT [Staphylococcus caeli]|uniref:type II toxin-antitoxin system toxin TscT n=1 Tax=Staphylococcus caeli TaxID=2201815 RepID=UPI003F55FCEB
MDLRLNDLFCEIEVIKEKLEDLKSTHSWFIADSFCYNSLTTMEEVTRYGRAYDEHRIHCEQLHDLMHMYTEELDKKINQFHEIEKASRENFGEESRNA